MSDDIEIFGRVGLEGAAAGADKTAARFVEATHGGRVTAWHGLGKQLQGDSLTFSDLMSNGINYRVAFSDSLQANGRPIDFARAIIREDTGNPLAIVGNRYEITQHTDFFRDVDVALGGAKFETAGVLRNGREVFALVQAGQFKVKGKDLTENYVFFRTSYDGTSPTKAKAVNTRVVCSNTTKIALRETGTSFDYSFRHTKASADRIKDVLASVGTAQKAIEAFAGKAEKLANEEATPDLVGTIVKAAVVKAFGETKSSDTKRAADKRAEDAKGAAQYMLAALGLDENKDMGKWGLYNAVSQWTDHDLAYRQRETTGGSKAEKRMDSILDGRGDEIKQAIFTAIYQTTDGREIEIPVLSPRGGHQAVGAALLDSILS
jgi:phage/plasmid-like protein (TIGR03299 family)